MTDKILPLPNDAMHLKGHSDWITNIAVPFGEKKIVTASADKTVRVFSIAEGQCLQTLQGHESFVRGIEAIDAETVLSVCDDRKVRVWSLVDGRLLNLNGMKERATSCASLGGGRLLVGGLDGGLHEFTWTHFQLSISRSVFNAHSSRIRRISTHNGLIATASVDRTVKLWDAATLKHVRTLTGHSDNVECVALNANYVVSGSQDSVLLVYDTTSFRLLRAISTHDSWIQEVCFVSSGKSVLSGSRDKTIALHDLPSGECLWRMQVGIRINALAVLSDGRVAVGGRDPCDIRVFATPLCQGLQQEMKSSELTTAFACALSDPTVLDEAFLSTYIRASYIKTAADLLAGHNLILLSIRVGAITHDNIRDFGGSSWYLKDNLYLPATKIDTEDSQLIHLIFHHAESLGIIAGGYALKVAQEIRVDVKKEAKAVIQAINAVSQRVTALERRASTLEGNVQQIHAALMKVHLNQQTLQEAVLGLSRNLTSLQTAIRKQNRNMTYVSIARCVLSFIPLVGNAIGSTAYTATEVLMNLTAEHLVPAGVDAAKAVITEMAQVDLSNFQVAQYVFSQDTLARLESRAKSAIMKAVSGSSFQTLQSLQSNLNEQIALTGSSDPSRALLDIGSSLWLSKASEATAGSSSSGVNSLDEGARKYFQYLAHASGSKRLTVVTAKIELNHVLGRTDGLSEVSPKRLEDLYFELAHEDDVDVSEEVFVRMFSAVREDQERAKKTQKLLSECLACFQKHADADGSVPQRVAARVLRSLYIEMERQGFVEAGSSLGFDSALEALRRLGATASNDESTTEDVFMSALKALIK